MDGEEPGSWTSAHSNIFVCFNDSNIVRELAGKKVALSAWKAAPHPHKVKFEWIFT